ncbi:mitochondrial ribosomal protein L27-domain-containing protein [Gaertneriomyces semiglobifer]|nr:mitochondrial ribosomal protein L27-domain-containing protein [Gaertneriomyces semiglobifer]
MGMTDVFRGLARGATRRVMTGKHGNKNFYKGHGGGRMGRWTAKGRYILEPWQFRQWVVPELDGFQLSPYVSKEAEKDIRRPHTYRDYFEANNLPEDLDPELAARLQKHSWTAFKERLEMQRSEGEARMEVSPQ